jgi:hypothetical protein
MISDSCSDADCKVLIKCGGQNLMPPKRGDFGGWALR